MLFTIKLVAAASLIAMTIANPLPSREVARKLSKRSEGIHLVNCGDIYSVVDYCPDDSNCDHIPFTGDGCIPNGSGLNRWEGSSQSCTFPTGSSFVWNIASNAQSDADYSAVGTGSNGFHGFNIFKDDQHVLYVDANGNECKSIYYCLDE